MDYPNGISLPVTGLAPASADSRPTALLAVWTDVKDLPVPAALATLRQKADDAPVAVRVWGIDLPAVPLWTAAAALVVALTVDARRRRSRAVFLSHAHEDAAIAKRIALALGPDGPSIFVAPDALAPGAEYHSAIRQAIGRAELFVFLLSTHSIAQGRFTLSEVAEAERRWPHPEGRVLTVRLDPTPMAQVPPYLRAITILEPRGDVAADVASHVAMMLATARRRADWALAAGLTVVCATLAWLVATRP